MIWLLKNGASAHIADLEWTLMEYHDSRNSQFFTLTLLT